MRRQFLDIEQHQAMRGEGALDGRAEREIGEMFVINLIELILLDGLQQMRKLGSQYAASLRSCCVAPMKSFKSGTWASTLFATIRSAASPLGRAASYAPRPAEELTTVGTPRSIALCDVSRRLRTPSGECRAATKYCKR